MMEAPISPRGDGGNNAAALQREVKNLRMQITELKQREAQLLSQRLKGQEVAGTQVSELQRECEELRRTAEAAREDRLRFQAELRFETQEKQKLDSENRHLRLTVHEVEQDLNEITSKESRSQQLELENAQVKRRVLDLERELKDIEKLKIERENEVEDLQTELEDVGDRLRRAEEDAEESRQQKELAQTELMESRNQAQLMPPMTGNSFATPNYSITNTMSAKGVRSRHESMLMGQTNPRFVLHGGNRQNAETGATGGNELDATSRGRGINLNYDRAVDRDEDEDDLVDDATPRPSYSMDIEMDEIRACDPPHQPPDHHQYDNVVRSHRRRDSLDSVASNQVPLVEDQHSPLYSRNFSPRDALAASTSSQNLYADEGRHGAGGASSGSKHSVERASNTTRGSSTKGAAAEEGSRGVQKDPRGQNRKPANSSKSSRKNKGPCPCCAMM